MTIYVKKWIINTLNVKWAIVWDKSMKCEVLDDEWINCCIVIVHDYLSCAKPSMIMTNCLVSEMLKCMISMRNWLNDYKSNWLKPLSEVNMCEARVWTNVTFEFWLWVTNCLKEIRLFELLTLRKRVVESFKHKLLTQYFNQRENQGVKFYIVCCCQVKKLLCLGCTNSYGFH